ncbi:hypothetical protein LPUS_01271 [Lasallia pustulata]|uniref:Uncharacterized protein n=1 Tax=Lasallia pustulata TaxID=136370 RepID=A0A1W5D967_9LECA|nr:hypothetical protein LPUS_01271 [Lasallia pustulata]
MLAASRLNYPGAEALNRIHARAHGEKKVLSVHMGTLACMTGVTRFMELPGPKSRDISVAQAHGTLWVYDKTDDSRYTAEEAKSSSILSPNAERDQLLHPEFGIVLIRFWRRGPRRLLASGRFWMWWMGLRGSSLEARRGGAGG